MALFTRPQELHYCDGSFICGLGKGLSCAALELLEIDCGSNNTDTDNTSNKTIVSTASMLA